MVLQGWEIKAIRAGQVQLTDGYVVIRDGELYLIGCRINRAAQRLHPCQPRSRPHQEAAAPQGRDQAPGRQGRTERVHASVPLNLHYKGGRVKAEIALAKGKAEHDKAPHREGARLGPREGSTDATQGLLQAVQGQHMTPRRIQDLPGPARAADRRNAFRSSATACTRTSRRGAASSDPYFRFRLGRRQLMGVTDHEAVTAALRDRPDGFPAHPAARVDRQRDGSGTGRVRRQRRRLEAPAPDGDGRFRSDPRARLLPVIGQGGPAPARAVGFGGGRRASDRVATRPDALHGPTPSRAWRSAPK